jgi:hypothetical protein
MFLVWAGLLAGALYAYLIERFASSPSRYDNATSIWDGRHRPAAPPSHRSQLLIALWVPIGVCGFVLLVVLIAAILESDEIVSGAVLPPYWWRLVVVLGRNIGLPLISGAAIGVWLYRTAGATPASTGGAVALSAVGIAAILTLALASEGQYDWFQRLSKLSVGGAAVELSPSAGASETKPDQRPGSAEERGVAAGPGTVSLALRTALNIDSYVKKDRIRVGALGSFADFDGDVPDAAESFFRTAVKPTAFALSMIHVRKQPKDIYATTIDHDFVEVVRKLSIYSYYDDAAPTSGHAISDEYRQDLRVFQRGVRKIWAQICEDERIYLTPEQYKNADDQYREIFKVAAMPPCQMRANDVASAIDHAVAEKEAENSYVLARSRPYGPILSAAILTAAGENDAAIADLSAAAQELSLWLKRNFDPGRTTAKRIFLYRILGTLDNFLMAKGSDKNADFQSLIYLSKTMDLGDELVRQIDDDSLKRYIKATAHKAACPTRSNKEAFDEMLLQDLIITNNFVFKLSKYPDLVNSQYSATRVAEKADFLTSIDLDCLIPADAARNLERALYDTQTLAFSALAQITKAENQGAWRDYMCQALTAAKRARSLVTIQTNMLSSAGFELSLDTKDGANEQRDHLVMLEDTLNLEALARQIRSDLSQAGDNADCL